MEKSKTPRGFGRAEIDGIHGQTLYIQESAAVFFDYEDALDNPGSSALWIEAQEKVLFNRRMVQDLVDTLQGWLDNKTIREEGE